MTAVVGIGLGGPLSVVALIAGLALGALVAGGLAVSARRLLGLNGGAIRTAVAGMVGYTVAALLSSALQPLGPAPKHPDRRPRARA